MVVARRVDVPANGRREKATFPSGQVVERSCGGTTSGSAEAAAVVDAVVVEAAAAAAGDEAKERDAVVAVNNNCWSAIRLVASFEEYSFSTIPSSPSSLSLESEVNCSSVVVRVVVVVVVAADDFILLS